MVRVIGNWVVGSWIFGEFAGDPAKPGDRVWRALDGKEGGIHEKDYGDEDEDGEEREGR